MKNIILFILFLFAAPVFAQDTLYCIQLFSTRNLHLVKPEMVSMTYDTVMVEFAHDGWNRVVVPYTTLEEADLMLHTWQRGHRNAFIVARPVAEVAKMVPLFTWD